MLIYAFKQAAQIQSNGKLANREKFLTGNTDVMVDLTTGTHKYEIVEPHT